MAEWITVINPDLDGTLPKKVTREHFELNLKPKGFVIEGEDRPVDWNKADEEE